jgi:hypothetical protein
MELMLEEHMTIYGEVGDTLDTVWIVDPVNTDSLPPAHSTQRRRRQPTSGSTA